MIFRKALKRIYVLFYWVLLLAFRDESVADPPLGRDVHRLPRVRFDLLAQVPDIHLEASNVLPVLRSQTSRRISRCMTGRPSFVTR